MIAAMILPSSSQQMGDETLEAVIQTAMKSSLVACNRMTGPFRIAFFERGHIPAGWARMGCCERVCTPPQRAA